MTFSRTSLASGVELIAEVDARYVCESITSQRGLELATLFYFMRENCSDVSGTWWDAEFLYFCFLLP